MRVARMHRLVTATAIQLAACSAWTAPAAALDPACHERPASACVLKAADDVAQALRLHVGAVDAFQVLAALYARVGRLGAAVEAADRSINRGQSLHHAAAALAESGRFEAALQMARRIPEKDRRVSGWRTLALVAIAEAAIKADQAELAGRIADEARHLPDMSDRDPLSIDAPRAVAALLARLGRLEQALEIAAATTPKSPVLQRVVKALAAAGQFDSAVQVAGRIPGYYGAAARADAAEALARAGQDSRADRLFEEAWQVTGEIHGNSQPRIQYYVVRAMARAGRFPRAEVLAGMIDDPPSRASALAEIGAGYALAGQDAKARRLFREAAAISTDLDVLKLDYPGPHGEASIRGMDYRASVAEVVARAGDIDEAERLVSRMVDSYYRTRALMEIARAASARGRFEQAQPIINALPEQMYAPMATLDLITALAQTGARERRMALVVQALDLAATMQRASDLELEHLQALAAIADALAKAGL